MMLIRTFTLIFLTTTTTFSQIKLIGMFCSNSISEEDVTCINFKENNQFDYEISGCLGISTLGSGTYIFSRNSLKLKFDKSEQVQYSKIKIKHEAKEQKEAIVEFITTDEEGYFLPVTIFRKSDSKWFYTSQNNVNIKISQSRKQEEYKIIQMFSETVALKIDNKSNKKIYLSLFPKPPTIISNQTLKYQLYEISKNYFSIGKEYRDRFKRKI